jgi:hypothetical protein
LNSCAITIGDRPALAAFLGQLEYPVSFLDFETFAAAIPLFDGSCPFQQIPFQYSLHILRAANASPEHRHQTSDSVTAPLSRRRNHEKK